MNRVPQIASVTEFRNNHVAVLQKLGNGPVILAQHSQPVAVIVTPEQWNEQSDELQRLRRIIEGDRQFAEIATGDRVEFNLADMPQ